MWKKQLILIYVPSCLRPTKYNNKKNHWVQTTEKQKQNKKRNLQINVYVFFWEKKTNETKIY